MQRTSAMAGKARTIRMTSAPITGDEQDAIARVARASAVLFRIAERVDAKAEIKITILGWGLWNKRLAWSLPNQLM